VLILKLIQGRFPVEGGGDRTLIHPYWGPTTVHDAESLAWRHVMVVCARLRKIAIESPEIWSLVNVCWPERWVDLCIERAGVFPLHLVCHISTVASAERTSRLFSKARDVTVIFTSADGTPLEKWHDICCKILTTNANGSVRTLSLSDRPYPARNELTHKLMSVSGQSLGGPRSMITKLHLEGLRLADIPRFPHLECLELQDVVPPGHNPTWLHRWLATSPRLKRLSISPVPSRMLADNRLPLPVFLPNLAKFSAGSDFDSITTLLRIVPIPTKILSLSVRPKQDDTVVLAAHQAIHGDAIREMMLYVERFWRQRVNDRELPPAEIQQVKLDEDGHLKWHGFTIPTTANWQAHNELLIMIFFSDLAELGPFISHPTYCELVVDALDSPRFATIALELDRLEMLHTLRITSKTFSSIAEAACIQAWADERARVGRHPFRVEIGQRGRQRGVAMGKWRARVRWHPADGPLAESRWRNLDESDSD
jgi:hypothetical protein